jgi:hypothetical protein
MIAPFRLLPAAALVTLTGCGAFYHPVSAEDREAVTTCRADADRMFAAQNRYLISERDQSAAPFGGNQLPPNPSTGLSDQYQQDQMVDKCLARSAASSPSDTPPEAPPPTKP